MNIRSALIKLLDIILLSALLKSIDKGDYIMWTTPAATEMRFGFEVTMYVMNK